MVYKFPLQVPVYNIQTKEWSETTFNKREDFQNFLTRLLKEPGEYNFDVEETFEFIKHATYFKQNKMYEGRKFPELSRDRKKWWDTEKKKCRRGVIYINGDKTRYLSRFYYHWLNFLQIYDKAKNDFDFPDFWDTHYDLALCCVLAELDYKNIAVLKKRQMGASLFFLALIINSFWFDQGSVLKLGASLGAFLGMEDGCWKTLEFYRNFMNTHTDWYRECTPDKVGNWIQQREVLTPDGKKAYIGRKTSIRATSFEKSATSGVGGATTYMFHEEGGIAPKADETFGFMDPSMRSGHVRTGVFIISGSVGQLSQCKPLEKWIKRPSSDWFSRKTKWLDGKTTEAVCGIFIPEQYSMPPYIDDAGNSLVEEALKAIKREREEWEQQVKRGEKSVEEYRLHISQHPITIKEAFDWREESKFPIHLLEKQKDRIQKGEVFVEYLDIQRDTNGKPQFISTKRVPLPFPVQKNLPDKRGCVIVHERPWENINVGDVYASIDPVGEGKTLTSESLFCIQLWKMPIERIVHQNGESKMILEGDKMVASWTGRFDDINDSHDYASMLLEIYKARAVVEANVSLFINYMILKKRQMYLIPKDEIVFLKEISATSNALNDYGWKNTGTIFKSHLLSYGVESVKEVIHEDEIKDTGITIKHYGVERICDEWLLDEMMQYHDDLNVDRLVSYCALQAFIKLRIANFGYRKKVEYKDNLENNKNLYKLSVRSPFKTIGNSNNKNLDPRYNFKKTTFKNLR